MKITRPLGFGLLLFALAGRSFAGWVEIEQFEDGMRVYADPASATRSTVDGENTARLTHLVRWAQPQEDEGAPAYRSTVVHAAYDCGDKLERYLSSTAYTGPMGDGASVLQDNTAAESWYTISSASMEEKLWRLACGVT